jgi:proline racemase
MAWARGFSEHGREGELMSDLSYDTDVYAWAQHQAQALRAKDWSALDVENLAEEIESLGKEQAHAVESHLRILLAHLLKWQYQPQRRRRSWERSCLNARDEIDRRLRRNPSLRGQVAQFIADIYPKARRLAQAETRLPLATFPEDCPWAAAQVLDDDFFPGETN